MPLQLATNLIPRNGNKFFLLEDVFIKGGMLALPDLATRDLIPAGNRKAGMLVAIGASLFQLQSDLTTWTEYLLQPAVNAPIKHLQTVSQTVWNINHNRNNTFFFLQLYDTVGRQVQATEVQALDNNTIQVTFGQAVQGHAVILFI